MPRAIFSFADLKGDLDSIGELCGGFRWEDSGAEWLHAARRGSVQLNTSLAKRTMILPGVAGSSRGVSRKN